MNAILHPQGNVYNIRLAHSGQIDIPTEALSFSVQATIQNTGAQTWDTSDLLRVAIMLVEEHQREVIIPKTLASGRVIFDKKYVLPNEEYNFTVRLAVNRIPPGHYLLMMDLVVDAKYYLVNTGAERAVFDLWIRPSSEVDVKNLPIVKMPPPAPRRKWRLDPEVHSERHAFHTVLGDFQSRTPRKLAVVFDWGPLYFRHYAHFLEFAICLYSICREYIGNPDETILLIGNQEFSTGDNPDVQRLILSSIFSKWNILQSSETSDLQGATDIIYFHGSRQHTAMNRLLTDYRDLVSVWFPSFRDKCIGNVRHTTMRRNKKVALYAKRGASRALGTNAEVGLLSLLDSFGYDIEVADFGRMTIDEQIAHTKEASILLGVHGNNLTNAIWLSKDACLIELFPSGFHSFDFQILCETAGSRYLGVEGADYGFVHREGSRTPGWTLLPAPYRTLDHHNDSVDFVPLEVIEAFLAGLN